VSGGLRALQARAARRSIPLSLHLELTYRCNACCAHCLQDRRAAPAELDLAGWRAVLEQARRLGVLFVSLSGGEALLSPHFWDVAGVARGLGLAVRVFTNGIGLDRATVRRLAALSPLAVEVSVFSLDPARHDGVTGIPGSLSRAVRGLVALRRAGVAAVVKCPLLAPTAGDHAAVRRLAERLGAGVVFDPFIFAGVDGRSGPTRCRGDDRALEGYFADPATRAHDAPRSAPLAPDQAPCGMGRAFLVVAPDGEVHPCAALPLSAGNVRDASLEELWWRAPLFTRLRVRRIASLSACASCPRSGYCDRCSALALLEDGDLDGPSSRACRIAELRERAWGFAPPPGAPAPESRALRVLQDR
jgi:radical SAM protein with 4Fe4S-binding SPASM domain